MRFVTCSFIAIPRIYLPAIKYDDHDGVTMVSIVLTCAHQVQLFSSKLNQIIANNSQVASPGDASGSHCQLVAIRRPKVESKNHLNTELH